MEIIKYSIIAFLVSFFIQMAYILIMHIRKNRLMKSKDEKEVYKRNMKLVIKILIAIIVSVIISIITFYALGIAVIGFLRQGH